MVNRRWTLTVGLITVLCGVPAAYGQSTPKIPLQCSQSVTLADILNLDPVINEVNAVIYQNAKIKSLLSKAVLCEAIESRSGERCMALQNWNHQGRGRYTATSFCRRNYYYDVFAGNTDPNSKFYYGLCRGEISAGTIPYFRASYAQPFCRDLVKSSVEGGVDSFCRKTVSNGLIGDAKIRAAQAIAHCEADFAYFGGSSGCRSYSARRNDTQLLPCSVLAEARVATQTHNAALCHGSAMCLAVLGKPNACRIYSRQIVSHFCSDWGVPQAVKTIALENAFRRNVGQAPFHNGESFIAPAFLRGENELRRVAGLRPYRIGDQLISTMSKERRKHYIESKKAR